MNTDLAQARQRVENIRTRLPSSISVEALGVRPTAPYHLLLAREALVWRTEELARCACDMLERDDLAAGILLTRAVTESAAFVWRLKELLETRHKYSDKELRDKFSRMLFSEKNSDPNLPELFNIVTLVEHMDKQLPGVKQGYDHLSGFAHPNWSGVFGLFATHDQPNYTTTFGRGVDGTGARPNPVGGVIAGTSELAASNCATEALRHAVGEDGATRRGQPSLSQN